MYGIVPKRTVLFGMLGIVAACAGIVPGKLEEISVAPAAPPKTVRAFRRVIVRFDFSDNFTFLDDMIVLLFVNDYPNHGEARTGMRALSP